MQTKAITEPICKSTAVGRAVACAPVTQRARVRFSVGTSVLGELFSEFSLPVRQMSGSFMPRSSPNIIWPSLSTSFIIHYGRQWPEMLTRPKTLNIHIHKGYTSIHHMIKSQEHSHPHTVANNCSSPSLSLPKPAHFSLRCIVQCWMKTFIYLSIMMCP